MIFKYEICDSCETIQHCRAFGCVPLQPAQRKPLSNFAKAGIYVKYFGNPVPAAWYAAITELEAAYNIKD